ncbi:hypothetical protein [Galbibacter sp.]|uniref:hypothetical protein n=1 Tax=Galbibacter sp. TaxID=2918471 RepID=UPI003A9389D0
MKRSNTIQYLTFILLCFQFGCQPKPIVLNQKASITKLSDLGENPLLLQALTTAVDLNENQMSTLYANKTGANYAMNYQGSDFPIGSRIYQITWKRQPDSLWYGAFIPGRLVSVERITFSRDNSPKYSFFNAQLLEQKSGNDSLKTQQILSQPRAVSP